MTKLPSPERKNAQEIVSGEIRGKGDEQVHAEKPKGRIGRNRPHSSGELQIQTQELRRYIYKNMGQKRERLRALARCHQSKGEVNGTNYRDESQNLQVAKRRGEMSKRITFSSMDLIV